jgi:hypothetical protein
MMPLAAFRAAVEGLPRRRACFLDLVRTEGFLFCGSGASTEAWSSPCGRYVVRLTRRACAETSWADEISRRSSIFLPRIFWTVSFNKIYNVSLMEKLIHFRGPTKFVAMVDALGIEFFCLPPRLWKKTSGRKFEKILRDCGFVDHRGNMSDDYKELADAVIHVVRHNHCSPDIHSANIMARPSHPKIPVFLDPLH